jgi:hypothetical protein
MSIGRWAVGSAATAIIAVASWNSPPVIATEPASPIVQDARVAEPWRPGQPQLGIDVYWENNPADGDDAVRLKARRLLDQVIGMEANSVAVSFPFFVDPVSMNSVFVDERTPSPERLGILVEEAQKSRLRVTIRPLMDTAGLPEWRGILEPPDRAAWYASYEAFLAPYLSLAQQRDIDTVSIGAELSRLQLDPQWAGLIGSARALFAGELSYDANWDSYQDAVAGVPADVVTVDAYPVLPDLGDRPTEDEITAGWTRWLTGITAGQPAGLVISEVGGAAEDGLRWNPARVHTDGAALDEEIQRRWFAGACRAARDIGAGGFYWWKLDFHVDPARTDPDRDRHDSFLGRTAESGMRDCFLAWRSGNG